MSFKVCTDCQRAYPATRDYFYAHPTGANGLHARCKTCYKARRPRKGGKSGWQRARDRGLERLAQLQQNRQKAVEG